MKRKITEEQKRKKRRGGRRVVEAVLIKGRRETEGRGGAEGQTSRGERRVGGDRGKGSIEKRAGKGRR